MAFFGIGGSNKKTNVSEGVVHDSKQETDAQSHDILAEFEAQFSNQGPMPTEQTNHPIPETVHSQPTENRADPEDEIPDFDIDFHPSQPVEEPRSAPVSAPPPRAPISVPEPERARHEAPVPPPQRIPQAPPAQHYPAQPPRPPEPSPPRPPPRDPPRPQVPPAPPAQQMRPRPVSESLPDFDLPDFTSSFDERTRSEPATHEQWDFSEAFARPERTAPPDFEASRSPERSPVEAREPARSGPMRAPEPIRAQRAALPEPVQPVTNEPPRHYDIVLRDGALFIEKHELARHLSDLTALRTISSSTKRSFEEVDALAKDEKKIFTKMQTIVRSLQESLETSDTLLFSGDQ